MSTARWLLVGGTLWLVACGRCAALAQDSAIEAGDTASHHPEAGEADRSALAERCKLCGAGWTRSSTATPIHSNGWRRTTST